MGKEKKEGGRKVEEKTRGGGGRTDTKTTKHRLRGSNITLSLITKTIVSKNSKNILNIFPNNRKLNLCEFVTNRYYLNTCLEI